MSARDWLSWLSPYVGLAVAVIGGSFLIASRRPDRLKQVTDAAWQLKAEAEKETAEKEKRIVQLEAKVANNENRVGAIETKYLAQIEAMQILHAAEVKAMGLLHQQERDRSDRVIATLTLKVDDLERRLNEARPAGVDITTVTTVAEKQ